MNTAFHALNAILYPEQRASQLIDDCVALYGNDDPDMRAMAIAEFSAGRPAYWVIEDDTSLDSLVPLNRAAADQLSKQYANYGIWRDPDELEMRRYGRTVK